MLFIRFGNTNVVAMAVFVVVIDVVVAVAV